MPQLCCEHYPCILEGLTSAEETIIAQAHPVITILKLSSNNSFNLAWYRYVCRYSVLLPQNPGSLLDLLLSKITPIDKVVRVIWAYKSLPQPKQLSAFVSIQKYYVIGILRWLITNNPLYKNIEINHWLLTTWDDKFISSDIIDIIVDCNSDQHKQEGYAIDFCNGNFENNLDTAISYVGIEGDHINFGCVYSNIDNRKPNLSFQLLSAIGNIKAQALTLDLPKSDIVTFCIRDQLIPLNNWKDLHYFIFAFPCLFPFGTGDYLE